MDRGSTHRAQRNRDPGSTRAHLKAETSAWSDLWNLVVNRRSGQRGWWFHAAAHGLAQVSSGRDPAPQTPLDLTGPLLLTGQ